MFDDIDDEIIDDDDDDMDNDDDDNRNNKVGNRIASKRMGNLDLTLNVKDN